MSINQDEILQAFNFRHACKVFDDSKFVSRADFEVILETGRLSPSSFGLEPWRFLILQDPQLREKLLPHTWGGQKQIPTASYLLLTLYRKDIRYDSRYVQQFMREVQAYSEEAAVARSAILEQFQHHDFGLLNSEQGLHEWAARQTYIPLANMMTTAALLGIDSCPIEGFNKNGLEQLLAQELALDLKTWGVAHLVAFGYRLAAPVRNKTRQAQTDIVQWV